MSTTGADYEAADGTPPTSGGRGDGVAAASAASAPRSEPPEHAETGKPQHGAVYSLLRETVIVVGMAMLLSLIVKTWLLQAFYIPSASMNDTLVRGDRVIVSKLTPGPFDIERGDIVVFEDPDGWLPPPVNPRRSAVVTAVNDVLTFVGLLPSDEGNHLIKRVIGLPGDRVVCCDDNGKLTVNGAPITEPYVKTGDAPSLPTFDITVPAGKVWVMGDHRSDSSDSRFHDPGGTGAQGSVPMANIVGRGVAVVWPVPDWAWLGQPTATFAGVPQPKATPQAASPGTPRRAASAP